MSCSKLLPVLPEMPWNVKKLITASANSLTKVSLRRCSKEFKSHVDNSIFTYTKLSLSLWINRVKTHFALDFSHSRNRSFPENPAPVNLANVFRPDRQHGVTEDSIREAVNYFGKVLKRKNISVRLLVIVLAQFASISSKRLFMECFTEVLQSCGHKLKVGALQVRFDGDVNTISRILPHLEPGTLTMLKFQVDVTHHSYGKHFPLQSIAQTEQWKKAKMLHLTGFSANLPEEDIAHFNWCIADVQHLTLERVKQMVERALHNPDFGYTRLVFQTSEREAIEAYRNEIGSEIKIPGTDMCVTISFHSSLINVHKRKLSDYCFA